MAPPRSNDAPPGTPGVAIDGTERPAWVADHLSEAQLTLEMGLQWATALELAPGYGPAEKVVASTIWRKTIGKKIKKAWPTVRQLLQLTGIGSPATIVAALKRLCGDGWLLREVRAAGSRRLAPERPGAAGVGYRLAWPLHDCIGAPLDGGPERCGGPTAKGGLCTTRAGKGTTHRGTGPCWRHGGERANRKAASEDAARVDEQPGTAPRPEPAPAPPAPVADESLPAQPGVEERPMLQLVKHSRNVSPVDNSSIQLPLLQPVSNGMLQRLPINASTVGAGMLQRLPQNASTVETEEAIKELDQGANQEECGSDVCGAELEGAQQRAADGRFEPDSDEGGDSPDTLTVDQAHEVLDTLTEVMRDYHLSRAGHVLRKAGRRYTPDELVIEAAARARRITA